MNRRTYIGTVTFAYAAGAILWVYFSDRFIESIGGANGLGLFSTLKGFVFVAVTTALLYLTLHTLAASTGPGDKAPALALKGWHLFAILAMLTLPAGLVSYVVYRSASETLLSERSGQLKFLTEAVARSIDAHLSLQMAEVKALSRREAIRAAIVGVVGGSAGRSPVALKALSALLTDAVGMRVGVWTPQGEPLVATAPAPEGDTMGKLIGAARGVAGNALVAFTSGGNATVYIVPVVGPSDVTGEAIAFLSADVAPGAAGVERLAEFGGQIGRSGRALIARRTAPGWWAIAVPEGAGVQHAGLRAAGSGLLPDALARLADKAAAELAAQAVEAAGGEPLLVAVAPIKTADAVLIATVETSDLLDDVKGVAFLAAISAAAYLIVAGVLALLMVQRQQLRAALAEKEQAAALHAAEERFRATFEQAAIGIAHLDLDGRFLRVNATLCSLLGYDRDELLQLSYADVRQQPMAAGGPVPSNLATGAVIEARGEQPHVAKDGSEIWLTCVRSVARDRPQDHGYVILMASDATARRAAEQRLTLAQAVFTGTQEGLVVTDLSGRITAVNPAFVAITGHEEAEVLGHDMRLLSSGRHDRLFYELMWTSLKETGVWRGEIWNRHKDGTFYLQQTILSTVYDRAGVPEGYVGAFHDITQARRSEIEVDRLTRYDPLTGLPNRTLIYSLIEHELTRSDVQCAVLYIDIDHLKTINDSLGFAAGDLVLRAAAQRIRKTAPEDATIGRYGADEFIVLLVGGKGPEEAITLAVRLIDALAEPFTAEGVDNLVVEASIGISLLPEDAGDTTALLQHAHTAVFQAKSRGGKTYAFYTDALTRAAKARVQLVADLRRGLAEREFTLYYQPIIRLADMKIVGAEALVRWVRPDGEVMTPDHFIPVAEETGLIVPLGDFVLTSACDQMARWTKAGVPCAFITVNISARQLNATDICAHTAETLAAAGVAPGSIEFEITESMLFAADSDAEAKLRCIAEMGVKIAIDDFGTGYSSLAYLKRFPISKLKIDKSFVRDLPASVVDGEVVRAVIAMARALRIDIVAEGVEEPEQLAFLASHGCTFGQGYVWSCPVPPALFEGLFASEGRGTFARLGSR